METEPAPLAVGRARFPVGRAVPAIAALAALLAFCSPARIVWLDRAAGDSQFAYDAGGESLKIAQTVHGEGPGQGREPTLELDGAVMQGGGPRGAEIALLNADAADVSFHLIEVMRR